MYGFQVLLHLSVVYYTNLYYGSDVSTSGFPTCNGPEPPFYIGKIGAGTGGFKNSDFNTTTAEQADPPQTFAYWDLEGPDVNITGDTMTQWGTAQAQAFVKAWQTGTIAPMGILAVLRSFLASNSAIVGGERKRRQQEH